MFRLIQIIVVLNLASVSVICSDSVYSRQDYPPNFIFGSGTSAYQVEGAVNENGRSPSVWDTFANNGYYSNLATLQLEDVKLMAETGLDAYRLSISRSILIPSMVEEDLSIERVNLQYYNNLINELISYGIQPHVTLCHYDHPQALEDEYGGWVSRKIVKDFTDYSDVCFREFGDRVSYWTTLNEPNAFAVGGYDKGYFPPKRCSPPFGFNCTKGNSSTEPYLVAHHILLTHASVVQLYKRKYQSIQFGFIGINVLLFHYIPLTNSTKDVLATQRAYDFDVGLFMNPLVFGDYPDIVKKTAGSRLPVFTNFESKHVKGSFDFIGVNHYLRIYIKDKSNNLKSDNRDFQADMALEMVYEGNGSANGFPIMPGSLQFVLEYFKQVYGNPPVLQLKKMMTQRTSVLEDISRVKYISSYIGGLLNAVRNGSNAKGYFTWSFLDVFELLNGYESSFGLFYVDLDDPELKRYPKLSAHWYSHFLKGGGISSEKVMELGKESSIWSKNHFFQYNICINLNPYVNLCFI